MEEPSTTDRKLINKTISPNRAKKVVIKNANKSHYKRSKLAVQAAYVPLADE